MMVNLRRSLSNFSSIGKYRILFFGGANNFALKSLNSLNINRETGEKCELIDALAVVTSKETKDRRNPVRHYAQLHNLSCFSWPLTNVQALIGGHFDLGIVVSFGHLIPVEVIQQFPLGMLNVHSSLLPRWRGAAPEVHTILNGDAISGVTIMKIAPQEFDVGEIILQRSYDVPSRATTPELSSILADMGANLLIECLTNLDENLRNSRLQDYSSATKAPKIGQRMAQLDFRNQTREEIDRLHRAISHKIKLQTSWHGNKIHLDDIVEPELVDSNDSKSYLADKMNLSHAKPGSIAYIRRKKILCILFKDGWVGFRSVHIENRPTMTAADFYNGFISKVSPDKMHFTSTRAKKEKLVNS